MRVDYLSFVISFYGFWSGFAAYSDKVLSKYALLHKQNMGKSSFCTICALCLFTYLSTQWSLKMKVCEDQIDASLYTTVQIKFSGSFLTVRKRNISDDDCHVTFCFSH